MSDLQASLNDHAAQSNPPEVPTKSDQEVAQASHSRKSSEQVSVSVQSNAVTAGKSSSTEAEHQGEDTPANGRASNEDQDGQRAAQTALQTSSAGAQEKATSVSPSGNPPREKPADSTPTTSASKNKATASKPASKPPTKSKAPRRKKESFLARLFRTLVPCVGPSKALDVDGDNASAAPLRDEEKKEKAPEASTTSIGHGHSVEPSSTTSTNPLSPPLVVPSQHVPSVPPSADTNAETVVIVPPSPSRRLPTDETAGVTSGAVQPPGSTGTEDHDPDRGTDHSDGDQSSFHTDEEEAQDRTDVGAIHDDDDYDEEERLIMNGGAGIPIGPDGMPRPLLPALASQHYGRKCLVLDLDETLVHSSFKLIPQADYVVPVEIEWQWHNVYVIKRPGVDNFLKQMGELYEIVVFTASLSKYADPVLDKLDVHKVVSHRLFRESCYNHKGNYVKDLSQLGRPASDTIILDNSPASYIFHPNNAVPVSSWFNDPHDTELTDLVPFLADLRLTDDVRGVLDGGL